jgi:hypothetical protein
LRPPRAIASGLLLAALLTACQNAAPGTRTDLRAYLQHTRSWAPVEGETARTLERILATEFVNEAEVRRQIADSRPRVLTHLELARAYEPHSKTVAQIHARYIAAWEALLRGYDAIEQGFTTGDYTKLARGREGLAEWRDGLVGVARELRELKERFGIDTEGAVES